MKKRVAAWLLALVMLLALVGCGNDFNTATIITGESQTQQYDSLSADESSDDTPGTGSDASAIDETGSYTSKEDVALCIHTYGHLPDNFITKKEAQALEAALGGYAAAVRRVLADCAAENPKFFVVWEEDTP